MGGGAVSYLILGPLWIREAPWSDGGEEVRPSAVPT